MEQPPKELNHGERNLKPVLKQISELMKTAQGLAKAFNDETIANTQFKAELKTELGNVKIQAESLTRIILQGNGQPALVAQVHTFRSELQVYQKQLEEVREMLGDADKATLRCLSDFEKEMERQLRELRVDLEKQINQNQSDQKGANQTLKTDIEKKIYQSDLDRKAEYQRISGELNEVEDQKEKQRDRLWDFFREMLPHIITWTAILIMYAIKGF